MDVTGVMLLGSGDFCLLLRVLYRQVLQHPACSQSFSQLQSRACSSHSFSVQLGLVCVLRQEQAHGGGVWVCQTPASYRSALLRLLCLMCLQAFFLFGIEEIGVQIEEPFGILALEVCTDCGLACGISARLTSNQRSGHYNKVRPPSCQWCVIAACQFAEMVQQLAGMHDALSNIQYTVSCMVL